MSNPGPIPPYGCYGGDWVPQIYFYTNHDQEEVHLIAGIKVDSECVDAYQYVTLKKIWSQLYSKPVGYVILDLRNSAEIMGTQRVWQPAFNMIYNMPNDIKARVDEVLIESTTPFSYLRAFPNLQMVTVTDPGKQWYNDEDRGSGKRQVVNDSMCHLVRAILGCVQRQISVPQIDVGYFGHREDNTKFEMVHKECKKQVKTTDIICGQLVVDEEGRKFFEVTGAGGYKVKVTGFMWEGDKFPWKN